MKILFILLFCILWSGQQEAQGYSQQDISFFDCSEEEKKACLKKAKNRIQGLIDSVVKRY